MLSFLIFRGATSGMGGSEDTPTACSLAVFLFPIP